MLAPGEAEHRAAVGEIVEGIRDARLVGTDATDLDGVGGIGGTTVNEGRSDEGNDMMSTGEDEVANETFVAVDYEVSAKLLGFFMVLHEIC